MNRSRIDGGGLTYYLHDEVGAFRFRLAGDLSRHGTEDLDQARETAFSVLAGRSVIVDLTAIESIDEEGAGLLDRWHALGAQFVVTGRKPAERIRSMTGVPLRVGEASPTGAKWMPRWAANWLLAGTLAVLSVTVINGIGGW